MRPKPKGKISDLKVEAEKRVPEKVNSKGIDKLTEDVKKLPTVDLEKIAQLKELLAQGKLQIDEDLISEALIEEALSKLPK